MIKIIAAKLREENEGPVNGFHGPVHRARSRERVGAQWIKRTKDKMLKAVVLVQPEPDQALDAGANRAQQERRKMRVIGRLRFGLALRPPRFGTADRRHA
jgi:hypothetical protein